MKSSLGKILFKINEIRKKEEIFYFNKKIDVFKAVYILMWFGDVAVNVEIPGRLRQCEHHTFEFFVQYYLTSFNKISIKLK